MRHDIPAHVRRWVAWARALVYRVLDTVPPVRRTVDELIRVEFFDRAMVITAQGLLALVPLVVVLAAFLPDELTELAVARFQDVTGIAEASTEAALDAAGQATTLDSDQVRTQTGVIGLLITLLSASSFARAVQRMYDRVYDKPHEPGLRGRRRGLGWLLGWLLAMQLLSVLGWVEEEVDVATLEPLWIILRVSVMTMIWWWSMHTLLAGSVAWWPLLLPAALTGAVLVSYSAGSSVVMPRYAAASAQQFGAFGLVLAMAAWLVGFACVVVGCAIVGRVLREDQFTRTLVYRLWNAVFGRLSGSRPGAGSPPG